MKILFCLIAALLLASYPVEGSYVDCSEDEINNDVSLNLALQVGVKYVFDKAALTYKITTDNLSVTQITSVSKEDLATKVTYQYDLTATNNNGATIKTTFSVEYNVATQGCVVKKFSYKIEIKTNVSTNTCAKVDAASLVSQVTQVGVDYVFQLAANEYDVSTQGVVISQVNSVNTQVSDTKISYACDVEATNADGVVVHSTFTVEYTCKTQAITVKSWSYTVNYNYCANVDADSLVKDILQVGIEYVFQQAAGKYGLSTNNVEVTTVNSVEIEGQENEIEYVCDVDATNEDGAIVHSTFIITYDCETTEKIVTNWTIEVNDDCSDEEEEVEEEEPEEEEIEEEDEDNEEEEEVEEEEEICEEEPEEEEIEEEEPEEEEVEEEDEDNEEEEEEEIVDEEEEEPEEEEEIEEEEPEEEEVEEEDEDNEEEEEVEEEIEEEEPEEEEEEIEEEPEEEEEEQETEEVEEECDNSDEEEEIEEDEEEGCYGSDEGDDSRDVRVEVDISVHVEVDVDPGCGTVHTKVN